MSAFASSSRLTLSYALASSSSTSSRRLFATSSRAEAWRLHLTFANQETTLELPSMSSLLRTFMPRHNMPQLAYIANDSIASRTHDIDEVVDWDGVLNAVPKSKVSHSRKAMRHANKGLKDRVDLVHCQGCGKPKLAHHICGSCYSIINRAQKAAKKEQLHSRPTSSNQRSLDSPSTSV